MSDQIIEIVESSPSSSMIKVSKHEIYSYTVFLDEDIGEPKKYRDLIHQLYTTSDNDEYNLVINSDGGDLSSALAIVEAIKNSESLVRAVITGKCHSAASIIALNCHEIVVTDSACMMTHTATYGSHGQVHNVKSHTDFSTTFIHKILDTTYSGFLTGPELTDLKKGVDVWLQADDIRKRLDSRVKWMNAQKAKSEKPIKTKK